MKICREMSGRDSMYIVNMKLVKSMLYANTDSLGNCILTYRKIEIKKNTQGRLRKNSSENQVFRWASDICLPFFSRLPLAALSPSL